MASLSTAAVAIDTDAKSSIFIRWFNSYRAWRQKRRDLAELRSLSGSALRDLAIDRSELSSIVHAREGERRRNRD